MAHTQNRRIASVATPLPKDELLFYRMTGSEQLSELFEYEIDLLSEKNNIDLKKILGKGMTVKLETAEDTPRYFHGIVTRFSQFGSLGGLVAYRAVLRPKPWLLTLATNCRIMETNKTVPDIVKKILGDHGYSDLEIHLGGSYAYPPREYCVQYRETDFNFISRLLEEEGIHYYFKHEDGKHTMVLCDSITGHATAPGLAAGVPYFPPDNRQRRDQDHLHEWNLTQEMQPGAYDLTDYDFTKPKTDLHVKSAIPGSHAEADKEVYDYPGDYTEKADGKHYVTARMEQLRSEYERIQTRGNTRTLAVGNLFKLVDYPRADQNREYLTISSVLQVQTNEYDSLGLASAVEEYQCTYIVMDSQYSYRPPLLTRKPVVQGPQTAVVVGKSGEEIYTDKYGRIKIKFHWDRRSTSNEENSCWVRVSQVWAGKQWGAMHIPRIGQEVIVDFLEGDPDRPIVTGRVYNDEQMPPYALPDDKTQSGVKSRSSKNGTADHFNEIRFEDKRGEEEMYIHAEKDFQLIVENNDTKKVGFDKKDPGNQTLDIYNHRTVTIDQGNDSLTVKTGNRTTEIKTGNRKTEIKMGNDSLKLGMGNLSTKLDLGKIEEEAMQSIELKVGQSSIKIDQMGVTIKGMMISIEGQIKLDMKAVLTTVSADAILTVKGGLTMIN
ncbi:MAG: type VI secretion system Vgr family protein [Candidatus Methylumidiphilus sp.]